MTNLLDRIKNFSQIPEYSARPRRSLAFMSALLLLLLAAVLIMEIFYLPPPLQGRQEEIHAARLMSQALESLRLARLARNLPLEPVLDPNATGMIGWEYSDITTTLGYLPAKRTSTNPAFAGLMVRLLREAGCQAGDKVGVTFTGSFPALNVAVLAACAALNLEPRIVSSVGASSYGANIPGFTWLDMEKHLYNNGIFPYISLAVSYGGVVETGGGIDGTGLELAREAVERHGAPLLAEGDYSQVAGDVARRKALLDANGRLACYINVGGALTALGWVASSARLDNGLLREIPPERDPARGLIFLYMEEKIPVIHLLNIDRLARRYALPVDPIPLPEADEENNAYDKRYYQMLAILIIWGAVSLFFLGRELKQAEKTGG
jgi:poly-gamma-glutamate system protein